jgi:hypothetical protein
MTVFIGFCTIQRLQTPTARLGTHHPKLKGTSIQPNKTYTGREMGEKCHKVYNRV